MKKPSLFSTILSYHLPPSCTGTKRDKGDKGDKGSGGAGGGGGSILSTSGQGKRTRIKCDRCGFETRSWVMRHVQYEDGTICCWPCFLSPYSKRQRRECKDCRITWPMTEEYWYKNPRYRYDPERAVHAVKYCRVCTDRYLIRRDKRTCWNCYRVQPKYMYTEKMWHREVGSPIVCIRCRDTKNYRTAKLGRMEKQDMDRTAMEQRTRVVVEKRCALCKKIKPSGDFYLVMRKGERVPYSYCISCSRAYNMQRYFSGKIKRSKLTGRVLGRYNTVFLSAMDPQELVNAWQDGMEEVKWEDEGTLKRAVAMLTKDGRHKWPDEGLDKRSDEGLRENNNGQGQTESGWYQGRRKNGCRFRYVPRTKRASHCAGTGHTS